MDGLGLGIAVDDGRAGHILAAEIETEEDCEDIPMPTIESGMGWPPPADEDSQVEPALYHEQSRAAQLSRNSNRVRSTVRIRTVRSRRLQHCR